MPGDSYPRVLFVAFGALDDATGGGITFSNLFRGWPEDALAVVTNAPSPSAPEPLGPGYGLGSRELAWMAPFRWLPGFFRPRPATGQSATADAERTPPSGVIRTLRRCASLILKDAGIPDRGKLSPELRDWICAFRPDVLFTILGSLGTIDLVQDIQRAFHLPLVVHLMDDGMTDPHRRGLFGPYLRWAQNRRFRALLRTTTARMAICDDMAREYETRYGAPFLSFQNTVDVGEWLSLPKEPVVVAKPARLVYAGSILRCAQAQSLLDCCYAVQDLAAQGQPIEFHVYPASPADAELQAAASPEGPVFLHDAIHDEALFRRTLAGADVLVLPVNFDPDSVRFIRLSMPAKVPAYLASHTPILVYGPPEVAQVKYARRHGWGYVVGRRDRQALTDGMTRVSTDTALRAALAEAATQSARNFHDAAQVRTAFQATLRAAAACPTGANTALASSGS